MLLPRVTYDLSATPRGRAYDAVTQLREIPVRKSSLLEVYPAQGMTTWVPTLAPQLLVTRPGSISAFLPHHARRLPLGRGPLSGRVCPSDSPKVAWIATSLHLMHGYFTSQVTPYWYWEYDLEATFLFSLLLFWGTEAWGLHARTVATPKAVNTLTFLHGAPWWVPSYVWLWSAPEDGSVHSFMTVVTSFWVWSAFNTGSLTKDSFFNLICNG